MPKSKTANGIATLVKVKALLDKAAKASKALLDKAANANATKQK